MRFLENESLLRALDIIKAIASTSPKQLQASQELADATQLDSLILNLWETVDAATRCNYILLANPWRPVTHVRAHGAQPQLTGFLKRAPGPGPA